MSIEVVTAGRTGTPDWQLDRMFESECAAAWEKENECTPTQLSQKGFEQINYAWAALETARLNFQFLEEQFGTAINSIEGTPESDKLASLYDSLIDIKLEAQKIREALHQAKHEAFMEGRCAG